ncbi:MAG: exopolysaccharide biosynthesis polyprenyl glycosylphosphotransferase [Flavobacteriales bacterium]|nr:exopolysaccharide biosynthesis polyprenyl glycosylphosphotransferase [Flavobacteriales bacterium]
MRKLSPSIEFSIWERKLLLFIVDFLILMISLLVYYKIDSPDLRYHEIITVKDGGLFYGVTLFWILSSIFKLYDLEIANTTRKILPLVFFIGLLFPTMFMFTPRITPYLPSQRIIILGFALGFASLLSLWRVFYAYLIHAPRFFRNVIVLISSDFDDEFAAKMKKNIEGSNEHNGYRIKRFYSLSTKNKSDLSLERMLDKVVSNRIVDNIIILDQDHENISVGLNKVLIKAIQNGVDVQTYLNLYEDLTEALPLNLAGRQFYTIFPISRHNSNYFYQLWNRVLDILSSVFGLFITILIIPFIFVINLFVNRGPLFYSQLRVGQGGDEFKITKFRSMVINAEESGAKMATKGDARITKFGGFMRKTRIDELPQFWAVLSGYMSLIGPRPERKVFVDQLSEKIPFYNARHLVKPGITGWAQVKYPYGENLEDSYNKLEYDLYYIKNRSVTIDIRIVLKTISTIIFSKGQ